jgi:hypothetical protein
MDADIAIDLGDQPRGVAGELHLFGKIAFDDKQGHGRLSSG